MGIEFYDNRSDDWQEADDFADLQAWVDDEPGVFEVICNPQKSNWTFFLYQLDANDEKRRAKIFRDVFPSPPGVRWRLAMAILCANADVLESDGMSKLVSVAKCAMSEDPASNHHRQLLASWLDPQCQEVPFAGFRKDKKESDYWKAQSSSASKSIFTIVPLDTDFRIRVTEVEEVQATNLHDWLERALKFVYREIRMAGEVLSGDVMRLQCVKGVIGKDWIVSCKITSVSACDGSKCLLAHRGDHINFTVGMKFKSMDEIKVGSILAGVKYSSMLEVVGANGDGQLYDDLISFGWNPNERDSFNRNVLYWAVGRDLKTVKHFIEDLKVDPQIIMADGDGLLRRACEIADLNVIKYLVENCHLTVDFDREWLESKKCREEVIAYFFPKKDAPVVSDDDDDDDYDCSVDFDSSCSYDSVTNSILFDTDF